MAEFLDLQGTQVLINNIKEKITNPIKSKVDSQTPVQVIITNSTGNLSVSADQELIFRNAVIDGKPIELIIGDYKLSVFGVRCYMNDIGASTDYRLNAIGTYIDNFSKQHTIVITDDVTQYVPDIHVLDIVDSIIYINQSTDFQSLCTKDNATYIINCDIDGYYVGNNPLPKNSTLIFTENGCFTDTQLIGNNTKIISNSPIFMGDVYLEGTFACSIDPIWWPYDNPFMSLDYIRCTNTIVKLTRDYEINIKTPILVPKECVIDGDNHKLLLKNLTDTIAVQLSDRCTVKNLNIVFDTTCKNCIGISNNNETCSIFEISNVKVSEIWNETSTYNNIGMKFYVEGSKQYVTGGHINNVRCEFLKDGIQIYCKNLNNTASKSFSWLNQLYFDNIYISSTDNGVVTAFEDTGINNKADSCGPIYFSNYEFQCLKNTALMFKHYGKWDLYLNHGYSYDNDYKGVVADGGKVYSNNIAGCFKKNIENAQYTFKSPLNTNANIAGQVRNANLYDSVWIDLNNKSEYIVGQEYFSDITFRTAIYDPNSGTQTWQITSNKNNIELYGPSKESVSKIFPPKNKQYIKLDGIPDATGGTSDLFYYNSYAKNNGGGLKYSMYAKNYGLNEDIILLDIKRSINGSSIRLINNSGNVERYEFDVQVLDNAKKSIPIGSTIEGQLVLKFIDDTGATIPYAQHMTKYKSINIKASPNLFLKDYILHESSFAIVGTDLVIKFIATKNTTNDWISYSFDITYNRNVSPGTSNYTTGENGEIIVNKLSDAFFINTATLKVTNIWYQNNVSGTIILEWQNPGWIIIDTTLPYGTTKTNISVTSTGKTIKLGLPAALTNKLNTKSVCTISSTISDKTFLADYATTTIPSGIALYVHADKAIYFSYGNESNMSTGFRTIISLYN